MRKNTMKDRNGDWRNASRFDYGEFIIFDVKEKAVCSRKKACCFFFCLLKISTDKQTQVRKV